MAAVVLGVVNLVLLLWLASRKDSRGDMPGATLRADLLDANERTERELRQAVLDAARMGRDELAQNLVRFQQAIGSQQSETARTQNAQIDAFSQQLALLQKHVSDTLVQQLGQLGEGQLRRMSEVRTTLDQQLQQVRTTLVSQLDLVQQRSNAAVQQLAELQKQVTDTLARQLLILSEGNARRLSEMRAALDEQLHQLQASNEAKLEEMRRTVDEKLHATLEQRLGESFRQVAERLEQVHRGLGEMQQLAQGVGDLKHLLSNVKTRGVFGEAQLGTLLEQVFTADQYAAQVCVSPEKREAVDYAIRLPGRGEDGAPCWLPIDAKFPTEDYERLLDAQQCADAPGAEAAGKALENRIRLEARSIGDKYIAPPYTTDFAILFLPTEGLYAEVLRRPGLIEALQRQYHITLAGPTTLLAMLGSLQMGFRTLALERRSSEVWKVLGAVKTEFGKFGDVLARMRSQLQTVTNSIDAAEVRTRQMSRALKQVEALPEDQTRQILPRKVTGSLAADEEASEDEVSSPMAGRTS